VSKLVLDARSPDAAALVSSVAEPLRVAARADAVELGAAENPTEVPDIFVDVVH
jgi:hypothetical protein